MNRLTLNQVGQKQIKISTCYFERSEKPIQPEIKQKTLFPMLKLWDEYDKLDQLLQSKSINQVYQS